MKITPRKTLLRAAFILTVAVAGLTVAPHASPAHASAGPPTITVGISYTSSDAILHVSGIGYTVNGQVEIDVDQGLTYRLLTQAFVQASPTFTNCRVIGSFFTCARTGAISYDFHLARGIGAISVIATDLTSGQQSYTASAYIS